jgi:hypothetical protein
MSIRHTQGRTLFEMTRRSKSIGQGRLGAAPFVLAAVALGVPSAGLAVGGFEPAGGTSAMSMALATFTPASVDPQLAFELARKAAARGQSLRFTPASTAAANDRTYTVAVRVDPETARAISVRSAIAAAQGEEGLRTVSIAPTRYNLGIARGYQSFAKPETPTPKIELGRFEMPDLAAFRPSEGAKARPSRFQPRIALEQQEAVGRAPRTLEGAGEQAVDVGGSYRVLRNLNVTAGVRLSQERDRIAPLTDAEQDSQAVYVGTQFKF